MWCCPSFVGGRRSLIIWLTHEDLVAGGQGKSATIMLHRGMSLREALRIAEKHFGCLVSNPKRTGQILVSHPWIPKPERMSARRTTTSRHFVCYLRKLEELSYPQGTFLLFYPKFLTPRFGFVQNFFSDSHIFRSYFYKLVVADIFKGVFKFHNFGRVEMLCRAVAL